MYCFAINFSPLIENRSKRIGRWVSWQFLDSLVNGVLVWCSADVNEKLMENEWKTSPVVQYSVVAAVSMSKKARLNSLEFFNRKSLNDWVSKYELYDLFQPVIVYFHWKTVKCYSKNAISASTKCVTPGIIFFCNHAESVRWTFGFHLMLISFHFFNSQINSALPNKCTHS